MDNWLTLTDYFKNAPIKTKYIIIAYFSSDVSNDEDALQFMSEELKHMHDSIKNGQEDCMNQIMLKLNKY
jgi:hypothetical protein